jgi:hypothetical protein
MGIRNQCICQILKELVTIAMGEANAQEPGAALLVHTPDRESPWPAHANEVKVNLGHDRVMSGG